MRYEIMTVMELRKYKWSKVYEAAEEDLQQLLHTRRVEAERWVSEPNEVFAAHMHAHDMRLWCAEGSIVFTANGTKISLQAGDALDVPAYSAHEATAGLTGCVCYVSPKPDQNPILSIDND